MKHILNDQKSKIKTHNFYWYTYTFPYDHNYYLYNIIYVTAGTGCTAEQTIAATTTAQYLTSPAFPNDYTGWVDVIIIVIKVRGDIGIDRQSENKTIITQW